ncbi:hypothetical protein OG2516_00899 [Oceanicola granulosus HTCC2516]|uniref:Microcystinase C n=2 Tax=Oceanicola granulosus TaxID=252302 RepID=Q2CJ60_OCEGH|nr:hypothetical protein OG2516_00899 [Oceanicola granulosus HTCC2516]
MQETNTFAPTPTTLDTFRSYYVLRGDELETGYGDARVEVPAMLATLRDAEIAPVPLLAAYAAASGTVTRATFDALVGEMEERLGAAGPVDGLLLALHGALVVEDQPDGDGEIIARMRALLPDGVPIGVSLDLHGHITPLMLQPDTFHVGYRNYPHTDMYETGARTAALLANTLAGRRRPVMALAKCPVIVPAVNGRTTDGPFSPVAEAGRRAEAEGRVLHASVFPVQPWIDVPDLGFAALVCADGDVAAAEAVARELADETFARRDSFTFDLVPLREAVATGLASPGMTLVSDTGDAPTGGAAADSPAVLRALLEGGAAAHDRPSLLTLCDPPAAAAAHAAGQGAELTFRLGHAVSRGTPVEVRARVLSLSDGRYVMRDQGAQGLAIEMGPTAVLGIDAIRVAVRSRASMEWDTGIYTSQGLDPAGAALVFVKSPSHFRVAFGPLAARVLLADTPGPTRADVRQLPYAQVTRPLHPLDPL